MTALALAMQDAGWEVSGSDTGESFITDTILAKRGIEVFSDLAHPLPTNLDLLVYSAAYTPPITKVRALSLAEALADFLKDRSVIAVAGVGGKTTTSAMLATLMQAAGRDVGYYIGTGSVPGLPAPGASGSDPYFVVEADEYAIKKTDTRPKFALLSPKILITTNIIHDHPDIYPDEGSTLRAFTKLITSLAPGSVWIHSATDPLTQQIINLQGDSLKSLKSIKLIQYDTDHPLYSQLDLQVFGQHNQLDALAATLAAIEAGLTEQEALRAITSYHGAERRQERVGEVKGRLLYDDYGHHPEEIEATIKAFKQEFPNHRLVLIFESHTYSRTQSLFSEFAHALSLADQVYVMPIFESAREKGKTHTTNHHQLADQVVKLGTPAKSLEWETAAQEIINNSKDQDLLLTMGAGFVYKLHQQFKELL